MTTMRICRAALLTNVRLLIATTVSGVTSGEEHASGRGIPPIDDLLRSASLECFIWDRISSDITIFSDSVGSLLDASHLLDHTDIIDVRIFRETLIEIQAVQRATERRADLRSKHLGDRTRLLETFRVIREAALAGLVGLLAILYLPLTLSSSVLRMNKRLKDSKILLYD
jgi:hypothetical protein